MRRLTPEPLTAEAFAPFGTVIETTGAESFCSPISSGQNIAWVTAERPVPQSTRAA